MTAVSPDEASTEWLTCRGAVYSDHDNSSTPAVDDCSAKTNIYEKP